MSSSSFLCAVKLGDAVAVRKLLRQSRALAEHADETGQSPLHDAVEALIDNTCQDAEGLIDVVQTLLDSKADANSKSAIIQATPLQAVLQARSASIATEIARVLLKAGANPNSQDSLGEGPLSEAVLASNYEACKLLLQHGASPHIVNDSGQTAFDLAIEMEGKHIRGNKIRALIETACRDEFGPAAKKTLEEVSSVLSRGAKSTDKPKVKRERWRHRTKPEDEEHSGKQLQEAMNDRQESGMPRRSEPSTSSTSPPTRPVGSNYIIAESGRDFRVTLSLDVLFGFKATAISWEDEVDVEITPSSKFLEARVSGPSSEEGIPRICLVLSTPLSKEVQPDSVESQIKGSRLTFVLPKATLDASSSKPARELPEWCKRDKDRMISTSDIDDFSGSVAAQRRPSDTSSSSRYFDMVNNRRNTSGGETRNIGEFLYTAAENSTSSTSSQTYTRKPYEDDTILGERQQIVGATNGEKECSRESSKERRVGNDLYPTEDCDGVATNLTSPSDTSISKSDNWRHFVGDALPPAPPPPLTNAFRGCRGKFRCKCKDHATEDDGGATLIDSSKEETDEIKLLRHEGNDFYKANRYEEAREKYTKALHLQPNHPGILTNRAAASMMLADWHSAFQDSELATKLDDKNGRAHERHARCLLMLDRIKDAMQFCHDNLTDSASEGRENSEWRSFAGTAQRISKYETIFREVDTILASSGDESAACTVLQRLNELQSGFSEYEMKSNLGLHLRLCKVKAWLLPVAGESGQPAHVRQRWADDALGEVQRLNIEFPSNATICYWHALSLLRTGDRKKARESLKETMRLANGDHEGAEEALDCLRVSEAQKELGNQAFKGDRFDDALQHYDAAIQADRHRRDASFSASLFCNRGAAWQKQWDLQHALEDINKALTFFPKYAKALFRRGLLQIDLENYSDAASDFDKVADMEPNFAGLTENRRRARCWAKRPPVRNYYALLNVPFTVGEAELKRAYKAAALRWHPDKHPIENRAEAEKCFKEVKEGFEILSHADRRREYDGLDHYAEGDSRPRRTRGSV